MTIARYVILALMHFGHANIPLKDVVKALFADPEMNRIHRLAAVNSINWARILAQITYYFHSYFSLARQTGTDNPTVRFVVPTGNFGDILAGYFATRMGLPTEKLVIATNENDILHRFWKTGAYTKEPVRNEKQANGEPGHIGGFEEDGAKAHPGGVKETLAPAMDILVSSNFERLLWYLAYRTSKVSETNHRRMEAGEKVKGWLNQLKSEGGFSVSPEILAAAKENFASERVSDQQTIDTIKQIYGQTLPSSKQANGTANSTSKPATTGTEHEGHYILDPHSAIGIAASYRSIHQTSDPQTAWSRQPAHHISLATAHPAKFSHAVELALKDEPGFSFETVLPEQFVGLEEKEKRVTGCKAEWQAVREIVSREVEEELRGQR